MKYAIIIAAVLSIAALAQTPVDGHIAEGFISATRPSTQAQLDRYTLVSVDVTEDLEAFLVNGYPTPEIKAILNDDASDKSIL
ncbi:MAG: hypothetical protein KAR40_18500, partial [Candidatus Sabulitectum sp.]|nr:hypothetical protein [Candidatus Sabulitectum sp.]